MLLEKESSVIENSYYEASVQRGPPCPPLREAVRADICVVGGGYAGLSAALELVQRGYSVVLLEAQRMGWGASGRNGGQVIVGFGSEGEAAIEKQLTAEDARRAWDISVQGLALVQDRMQRHAIDCEFTPGYLSLAVRARKAPALQRWYEHVSTVYGYRLQWIAHQDLHQYIASERFHCAVWDPASGHIHPLKYCLGLASAAHRAGARMHENSPVHVLQPGERPVVKTAQGEVHCNFVVLAGNVYLDEYGRVAPDISARIMPVGTYMVATEPMGPKRADALMKGRPAASDTNFVLDYFRLSADHRLLFGAGESYSGSTPRNLVARIRRRMLAVFPQLSDLAITHAWGGFVDITLNRAPNFGRLGSNVYYLQGFSGHGVAISGMAGQMVAEAIAGQAERFDVFARLKHHAFPGGTHLRTPALVLGMLYYRLRDYL